MRETGRCAQLRGSPRPGCRVFRSSVADAQSWVSSGSLARSLVGIYFFYAREVDVQWPMGAWVRVGRAKQVASTGMIPFLAPLGLARLACV